MTLKANFVTRLGGFSTLTHLVWQSQGASASVARCAFNHAVRLYADPGTTVDVTTGRSDSNTSGRRKIGFSGYLVDKPQRSVVINSRLCNANGTRRSRRAPCGVYRVRGNPWPDIRPA